MTNINVQFKFFEEVFSTYVGSKSVESKVHRNDFETVFKSQEDIALTSSRFYTFVRKTEF